MNAPLGTTEKRIGKTGPGTVIAVVRQNGEIRKLRIRTLEADTRNGTDGWTCNLEDVKTFNRIRTFYPAYETVNVVG